MDSRSGERHVGGIGLRVLKLLLLLVGSRRGVAGGVDVSVDCKSSDSSGQAAFMYAPASSTHATQELNARMRDVISVYHPAKQELTTTGNLTSIMTSPANYASIETCLFLEIRLLLTVYCINIPHSKNNRRHVHARGD